MVSARPTRCVTGNALLGLFRLTGETLQKTESVNANTFFHDPAFFKIVTNGTRLACEFAPGSNPNSNIQGKETKVIVVRVK